MTTSRVHWTSRFAFILSAAGSAVGLGNIWKFPYIAGTNGGGAFVLVYLVCIAAVGIPIFIAELYIGQKSQCNAITAFEVTHKKGTWWRLPGWFGILSAFLILSFYSVVGGWVLDFEFKALFNQFAHQGEQETKGLLSNLFNSPLRQVFWHLIFISITVGIVLGGIKNGIERWNKILMPALFLLLIFLFIHSAFQPGFGKALQFMFSPDASKLTAAGVLEAVGHSFFTLSLGLGVMITYGSYLVKKGGIVQTTLTIAFLDTLIAMIAGVVIFSVVYSHNLEPGGGPSLMFQTLPVLFSKMTGGYLISVAFFTLVSFAAFTSAVSLLEVIITYWTESHGWNRKKTALLTGAAVFSLGLLSAFSTNLLSDFKIGGLTFFDLFDRITSSILLPMGGLFISLFYGWVLGPKAVAASIGKGNASSILAQGLLWSARVFAPLAVLIMLYHGLKDW